MLTYTLGMRFRKLPRSFYLRPTLTIAKQLLGKYLCRRIGSSRLQRGKKLLIGKIVEVEAYLGEKDPASHAYRGKTKRNEVMFRIGGYLYVYFTYGMHFCANVVTEKEGVPHAVLIRGVEPIQGIEMMIENRSKGQRGVTEHWSDGVPKDLTNGPAKLCEAFCIARAQNGTDLLANEIFIVEGETILKSEIGISTRIGIRYAAEKKWRFYVKGNMFVSKQ